VNVLWVEPISEVFAQLERNIATYPKQVAVQALVTDRDGQQHTLHIANNGGAWSSILELAQHKDGPTFTISTLSN
jgi:hypothetical protein